MDTKQEFTASTSTNLKKIKYRPITQKQRPAVSVISCWTRQIEFLPYRTKEGKMRKLIVVATLLITGSLSGCATWNWILGKRDYPLPDGKLSGSVICGEKRCIAGQNGAPFDFIKNPYSPSVDDATTPKQAAMQVVGFTSNNPYGRDPWTCSSHGVSPFTEADIASLGSPNGRSIDYSRTETLDIDVNGAVESDLTALQSAGVLQSAANLADVRAKLTEAYSALDQSKISVTARYFEFGLAGKAYRDVFEREAYPECVSILRSGKEVLITAVGLVWFDLDYKSNSVKELISEVNAALTSYGIKYNFGASVRREVNEALSATTKNGFQVITWTTADRSHFRTQ